MNVNFTTPQSNKTISTVNRIPLAPTFYAYWWPAQSPYNVYEGAFTAAVRVPVLATLTDTVSDSSAVIVSRSTVRSR